MSEVPVRPINPTLICTMRNFGNDPMRTVTVAPFGSPVTGEV